MVSPKLKFTFCQSLLSDIFYLLKIVDDKIGNQLRQKQVKTYHTLFRLCFLYFSGPL